MTVARRDMRLARLLAPGRFEGAGGVFIVGDVGGPEGAPLVCLGHGGGQTRHSWRDTAQRLASAGYRVVSIDLRGHGDSDWAPDGDYDLPVTAADLEAVVRANDQGAGVCLVGASWGGLTSLVAAPALADVPVRSIVLVDVVPRPDAKGGERIQRFLHAHLDGFATLDEAVAAVAAYRPDRPSGDPAGLMKNLRKRGDGRLYWHWDPARLKRKKRIDSALIEDAARQIRVPVMLVRGGRSDVVSDSGVEDLRDILPALEVVTIGGADHMVVDDDNRVFADALIGFLQRTAPPAIVVK
jgi:pimeloyl-ACP methyl ester carboxylesterase